MGGGGSQRALWKVGKHLEECYLKKLKVKVKSLMNKTVNIQQLEVVLVVKEHNPKSLNLEFLKDTGIIPIDWELAQPPTCTEDIALVSFQNGVYIVHQGDIVTFLEDTRSKGSGEVEVPQIAHKYVERLPQVNYQSVGINPKGYAAFNNNGEARKYLLETLLPPDRWHESERKIVQAVVNFVYNLDRGLFNLTVKNTALELSEEKVIPIVSFSGNFHRDIARIPEEDRFQVLSQIIENWQTDIETYREIVNKRFLEREVEQLV